MTDAPNRSRVRHHANLWINDRPDEYRGNGFTDGPHPHGYVYHAEGKRHVVSVSFEAMNGTSVRVNFDPETGAVDTSSPQGGIHWPLDKGDRHHLIRGLRQLSYGYARELADRLEATQCPSCSGTGYAPYIGGDDDDAPCLACDGDGFK